MEKSEAIRKLNNYIAVLNEIDATKAHLLEAKTRSKMYINVPEKRHMLGRYLWPFLAGATFVCLFLCLIGDRIFNAADYVWEMLFIFGLTAVYIFISIAIAKLIQNRQNKILAEEPAIQKRNERERREKIVQRYESELAKQESVINEMESILPGVCRNVESARVIQNALRLGKAQTIEEAVKVNMEG